MTHLFSRFRIRALGVAARLLATPTPFMLTGPGSSLELARLIANRGARSVLVATDGVFVKLGVVAPVPTYMSVADCTTVVRRAAGLPIGAATDHRARAVEARPEKKVV